MPIEIKDVSYVYMKKTPFERTALEHVSLTIQEGDFLAIAGQTGSGKSTLVQQLNGILQPTQGKVLVDGQDLSGKGKEIRQARCQVGMVFQYPEHQLFEETVAKDVAFGPQNMGLSPEEVEKRVREAMAFVNLDYDMYKDRSPFQLSGGQMRRAAIAGVIALQPKYLVLDEPTAGLDPWAREDLLQRIIELHEKKKVTIIFVSHNMDDIARIASRVLFMHQGKILLDAPPQKAFSEREVLEKAGLSAPQITQLLHQLQEQGLPIDPTVISLDQAVDNLYRALQRRKTCSQTSR